MSNYERDSSHTRAYASDVPASVRRKRASLAVSLVDNSLISSVTAPSATPSASSSINFEGSRMPQNRLGFLEEHPNDLLRIPKPKAKPKAKPKSPPKLEQLSRTSSTASKTADVCAMCLIANNETSIPVCTTMHKNKNVNHMFHEKCICDYVKHTANAKCPECRAELKKDLVAKCKNKKGGRKSIKKNSHKKRRTNKKR